MSAHTPGPWTVRTGRSGTLYVEGVHRNGGTWLLAEVSGRTDAENEANARLIAAAPELLAVVRTAMAQAAAEANGDAVRFPAWTAEATAAIARAGRPMRYSLMGADCVGDWIVCSDSSLPVLADQIQRWRAQATGSSRIYFICDSEADGAPVDEEEIEAALETYRDRRDKAAEIAANQED